MFRKTTLLVLLLSFSSACFAQAPDVLITPVQINYSRDPKSLLQEFTKFRVSPEGQALTKAVAAIYDIPPEVVDASTQFVWKPQVTNEGSNEHHGMLVSPAGYEICEARRVGEISISGRSSLTVSVWRSDRGHGFAWYADVPEAERFAGGEWVDAHYVATYVKANDPVVWKKYKHLCTPKDFELPAVYVIDQCKGPTDCKRVPYKFFPPPS